MAELSPRDVLSVLNQWELELTQLEAQRRSLKYIRDVTTAFQAMTSSLDEMEGRKKELEQAIAGLQDRYDGKRAVLRSETGKVREASEEELTDIANRVGQARVTLSTMEENVKEAEKRAAQRTREIDAEIITKTDDLERIKKGFEDFQRQHGLI